MKVTLFGLAVGGIVAACTTANPAATCGNGVCSNPMFPYCDETGIVSGEVNACIAVSCAPGDVKACVKDRALTCTATGDGYTEEPCSLGCAEGPAPHCRYLQPRYMPDVCDGSAGQATYTVASSGSLDPNLDANCTGGIFHQSALPDICVIRYGSISIAAPASLSVIGKSSGPGRSIAFVADGDLTIDGVLDVSGHAQVNGPGGGAVISGTAPSAVTTDSNSGGAGAGGATAGGNGGLSYNGGGGVDGGGWPGGMATANPALLAEFGGGAAGGMIDTASTLMVSGGGGGGVMLISCHGTVTVRGSVNAGGGGGMGGQPIIGVNVPGWGGGAGGVISIEGVHVTLTGSLFANGGAGGGGVMGGVGVNGEDGSQSDTEPAQGGSSSGAGAGGAGGIAGHVPGPGQRPSQTGASAGGGGGSVGFLQVFSPAGLDQHVEPAHVSPPLPSMGTALTR